VTTANLAEPLISEGISLTPDVYPLPQERSRPLVLFEKVQGAMRHIPNFMSTCKAVLDAVMDEIDAENCSLMLKDPVSGLLSVRAARGRNEDRTIFYADPFSRGTGLRPGLGIAGWVLKEGLSVMLSDVKEEPRFIKADGLNNDMRSLICFPVREKDQIVGVFNLSHSKKAAFSEGDRLAVAYISNQVGAALTSARFFLELQEINRLIGKTAEDDSSRTRPPSFSTFVEVGEMTEGEGMFLYTSEKMHQIKMIVDRVADADVTVLIQGESGVGKEVIARSIHMNSFRKDKSFIKVNCAALPPDLLESELFGYERGAFTGAYRSKPGKFELAHGGTIFLDEIVEMSPSLQAKLLQVLQDKTFSRLGGKKDIFVDVRVLAATNKDMATAVREGSFRDDLYYRLNVVGVYIPALRERKEEIPIFAEYFVNKFAKKYEKVPKPLPDRLMSAFLEHRWAGNVRELENMIQRFVVLGNEEAIMAELSPVAKQGIERKELEECFSLREVHKKAVMKTEFETIRKSLEMTNWNRKKAASLLNISYKTMLYKMKRFGL
jgi:transcriptional regulator with PAS, ATPase and Fis domain